MILKVKSDIYYKYDNLEKYLYRLCHKYQFYDDKDTLFYEIILNHYNFGKSDNNTLYVKEYFYVDLKSDYNKIKIVLSLTRINIRETISFDLEHINDNFINIIYLDKTDISLKIDKNKDDISKLKSNKIYLKNFENLIFRDYNYAILYNQSIPFYNKTFNFSFKKNDFIE